MLAINEQLKSSYMKIKELVMLVITLVIILSEMKSTLPEELIRSWGNSRFQNGQGAERDWKRKLLALLFDRIFRAIAYWFINGRRRTWYRYIFLYEHNLQQIHFSNQLNNQSVHVLIQLFCVLVTDGKMLGETTWLKCKS